MDKASLSAVGPTGMLPGWPASSIVTDLPCREEGHLGGCSLLQQELLFTVEQEDGEGSMQAASGLLLIEFVGFQLAAAPCNRLIKSDQDVYAFSTALGLSLATGR